MAFPHASLPEWVLFHIPHDSVLIPDECRELFVLNDADLEREMIRMTDLHTFELFAGGAAPERAVRFPVSRLLVDPERFPDDRDEPMAARGQRAWRKRVRPAYISLKSKWVMGRRYRSTVKKVRLTATEPINLNRSSQRGTRASPPRARATASQRQRSRQAAAQRRLESTVK